MDPGFLAALGPRMTRQNGLPQDCLHRRNPVILGPPQAEPGIHFQRHVAAMPWLSCKVPNQSSTSGSKKLQRICGNSLRMAASTRLMA